MQLSVATLNTWHGLDGNGLFAFGRLEKGDERKKRIKAQIHDLKLLDADILVLEELNPLPFASYLYGTQLGRKSFWTVANSGIKMGWGPPFNLSEGLAILTRPLWKVENLGSCQLSGGLRLKPLRMSLRLKNFISFQFHESRMAMATRVTIPAHGSQTTAQTLLVVATHLHHAAGMTPQNKQLVIEAALPENEAEALLDFFSAADARRLSEMENLLHWIFHIKNPKETVLLCGDFNCEIQSTCWDLLKRRGWEDVWEKLGMSENPLKAATWDPPRNALSYRSQKFHQGGEGIGPGANEVLKRADALPRRIDFIALWQDERIMTPQSIKRFGFKDEVAYQKSVPFHFIDNEAGPLISDHLGLFSEFVY